jgi:hypothetical protein
MRPAQLSLALLLAACGGASVEGGGSPLAVTVAGTVAPYAPAYLASPDLPARARAIAANAAEVWRGPGGALEGYQLVFEQQPFDCGRSGVEAAHIVGCTWEGQRLIQVLALGAACPEATVLAHEVGHALLGDNDHRDPRWRDRAFWVRMLAAMTRTAPPDCVLQRFIEFNEVGDDD